MHAMQGDSGSPLVGRIHVEGQEDRAVIVGILRGTSLHTCKVSGQ